MPANPDRRIKVRWAVGEWHYPEGDGIRVRIEAVCANGMPRTVFAYRMLPKDPVSGTEEGFFSHICSPTDLAEYPEYAPIPSHTPKWFRLHWVDVVVRSHVEAEKFVNDVVDDICRLKRSLDSKDEIEPTGAEDCGGDGTCPGSSSLSSYSSSSESLSSESLGPQKKIRATGTFENQSGFGTEWEEVGTGAGKGAGSPVGSSDSDSLNFSRVCLIQGGVSKTLMIQGFPLDDLPEDALIEDITALLWIRKEPAPSNSSQSSSSSLSSLSSEGVEPGARLYFINLYDPRGAWVGDNKANNNVIDGGDWEVLTFTMDLLEAEQLKRGGMGVGIVVGNTHDAKDCCIDVDGVELVIKYRG